MWPVNILSPLYSGLARTCGIYLFADGHTGRCHNFTITIKGRGGGGGGGGGGAQLYNQSIVRPPV